MFVAKEEHKGDRVVKLCKKSVQSRNEVTMIHTIHLLEVGNLIKVANIDDREVLDTVGNAVQNFVLSHTIWIPISAKPNNYETFLFRHDGLVDMPAGNEMGKYDRAHFDVLFVYA
jgi:hypothetical protein